MRSKNGIRIGEFETTWSMMGIQYDILSKIIFQLVCTTNIIEQWISGKPIVLDTHACLYQN